MPTASDLVTDLPADFETFGQAVATSMADLLGGTTGQILAKNSNTDMDFVWVANDQGDITGVTASSPLTGGGTSGAITLGILSGTTSNLGAVQLSDSTSSTSTTLAATANAVKTTYDLANGAIPKSLIDAAGDLIVGTAADTAGRLGIGSAGQVLKVNSGATALEWGTAGGASGLTLITKSDFSAVTSHSINNCFTSTYTNYFVVCTFTGGSSTASRYLTIKLRASGTDTSTGYTDNNLTQTGTYISGEENFRGTDEMFVGVFQGDKANGNATQFYLYAPQIAQKTLMTGHAVYDDQYNAGQRVIQGKLADTTAYDGFTLIVSADNMTGTVRVYGLQNS
jgi:hypothetical protein